MGGLRRRPWFDKEPAGKRARGPRPRRPVAPTRGAWWLSGVAVDIDWDERRMLLAGLTGGIATGKSSVSRRMAARGVSVIDADAVYARLSKRVRE